MGNTSDRIKKYLKRLSVWSISCQEIFNLIGFDCNGDFEE